MFSHRQFFLLDNLFVGNSFQKLLRSYVFAFLSSFRQNNYFSAVWSERWKAHNTIPLSLFYTCTLARFFSLSLSLSLSFSLSFSRTWLTISKLPLTQTHSKCLSITHSTHSFTSLSLTDTHIHYTKHKYTNIHSLSLSFIHIHTKVFPSYKHTRNFYYTNY